MNNTEMIIRAITSGNGGGDGGVELVGFDRTFEEVGQALGSGARVIFGDEITIETHGASVNLYMEINGASYIDFTPLGGDEQYSFSTIYDATGIPEIGKLMSINIICHDSDEWETRVKFIETAT